MYNIQSLSNKFPMIFWSLIFHILLPRWGYFAQPKGNLKINFVQMREELEKFSLL